MAPSFSSSLHVFFQLILLLSSGHIVSHGRFFTLTNDCNQTIWPVLMPPDGTFGGEDYALRAKESRFHKAPLGWSGVIWARTECKFDGGKGNLTCVTGGCGSSVKCSSLHDYMPITLAEFIENLYDVSLVFGFNLPISIRPVIKGVSKWPLKGNCSVVGCARDLRQSCPSKLSVKAGGKVVACRSACDVFNTDAYCCTGANNSSETCHPTYYSKKFKDACPNSYSYPYDDPTGLFKCSQTYHYHITFCGRI